MANNISGAGLSGIYNRLNGISQYHPLETETFSDWSTEAGDIVKVKRGDEEYDSPVHTSRMVWRGTPQMSLSSTGNQKRDAIAKVSKKKYRGGSGGLRNEEYIYKEFTSSDGMLWSSIFMSESRLQTIFTNGFTSVSSQITQTAEVINASVWGENSSIYSELKMTSTNIMTTVGSELDDVHTQIEQTKSMIRSSVWTANSTIWTEIQQTASFILDHVGARSGSKVFTGTEEPQDSQYHMTPGDIWVEGTLINTWDDFDANYPWNYDQYDWEALSGQKVHVWRDGKWNLVEDGTKLVEDTWFMRTKDRLDLVAKNVEKIDGEFRTNLGKLEVKADKISSTVTQHGKSIGELGSNITQTATQIRAEVHAAGSTLYSYIDMTATYIRTEVGNTVSGLQSSITQNANKIALVVESTASGNKIKPASIVAAINNGSSSVVISANHINLDGYVKATDLTSTYLSAQIANFALLSSERGGISVYSVGTTSYTQGGVDCYVPHAITSLRLTSSGNTYTLQKKWFSENDWSTVGTFSRAVSNWTWGGGNGKVWVKAQPQDQTLNVDLAVDGSAEITSNGTYTYKAYYGDDNDIYWDTGAHKTVTVSVSGDTPSKVEIWYADDSGVVPTRNITSAISIKPWCKIGNTWYPGSAITLTPDYAFSCNKRASLDDTYDANTLSFGSISKSYVSSASYIYFTVECGGHTKKCRIELT